MFLGRDFVTRKDYSEKKAEEIDEEVTRHPARALRRGASSCSPRTAPTLDRIAEALLERETLETRGAEAAARRPAAPAAAAARRARRSRRASRAPRRAEAEPSGKKLPAETSCPDPEPVPGLGAARRMPAIFPREPRDDRRRAER